MKKIILVALTAFLCLLPLVQGQEVGKELNVLLDKTVTDSQAAVQNLIFECKLLVEGSPEGQLSILQEKTNELMKTMENLNSQRADLTQTLQNGTMTGAEFAVEMQKLTTEMTAVARSMEILREKISESTVGLSENLYNRALTLIDTFSQMTHILSLMETSIAEEMQEHGHEPPQMPEIPEPPEPPSGSPPGSPPPSDSPPPGSPPPGSPPPGSPPPSDSPPPGSPPPPPP